MNKLLDTLKSSKFQAFLAVVFTSLGTAFSGEVMWEKALAAIVAAAIAYMGSRAYEDRAIQSFIYKTSGELNNDISYKVN